MKRIEKKETGSMSTSQAARTTTGAILALKNDDVLLVTEVDEETHIGITLLPSWEGRIGCHWFPDEASSEKETLEELQRDGYELVYLEDSLEFVNFLRERVK